MTEYITTKETAKMLREALRSEFPGVRFSVRCGTGTGSAWLSVAWTDGPTEILVRPVTWRYEGERFNGMTDSYDRVDNSLVVFPGQDLPREVRFVCSGVNTHRAISPDAVEWVARLVAKDPDEIRHGDIVSAAGEHVRNDFGARFAFEEIARKLDLRGVDFSAVTA